MNKIIFPLNERMRSPEVADLQDALKLMLEKVEIKPISPRLGAVWQRGLASERSSQTYGATTVTIVKAFQEQHQLRPDGQVGPTTTNAINKLLKEWGVLGESSESELSKYQVQGQIQQAYAPPLAGALVRAFDKDLRHEQLLGETTTDRQGLYAISYTQAQFRRAEKFSADLIVRVYNGEGVLLVESPIIFNSQSWETVDLMVPGEEKSEYERFLAELTPVLDGVRLEELTEDDISFLAGETGLELHYISLLVVAEKLAIATELAASVFYGLIRENLPTDLSSLLQQGREAQRLALEAAIANKIIPVISPETMDAILDRLHELLVESI